MREKVYIMKAAVDPRHPKGMVLIFALGILAMLAILGLSIFLTTKTDLQVSTDTHVGRNAFSNADLTARTAVLLARSVVLPSGGATSDLLSAGGLTGRPPFSINMNNFTLSGFQQLEDQVTDDLVKERYLIMAGTSGRKPHVEVYSKAGRQKNGVMIGNQVDVIIGTAAVAYGHGRVTDPGSNEEGSYSGSNVGAFAIPVFIVISADGRVPQINGAQLDSSPGSIDSDQANYIDGDASAKHSIVTTIYRELL